MFGSIMGSDNGHDNEFISFVSTQWSHGEKEFLRVLLSQRIASVVLCLLAEGMIYNYTVRGANWE